MVFLEVSTKNCEHNLTIFQHVCIYIVLLPGMVVLGSGGTVRSNSSSSNPSSRPSSDSLSSNWSGLSGSSVSRDNHFFPVWEYKYSTPNFSPELERSNFS